MTEFYLPGTARHVRLASAIVKDVFGNSTLVNMLDLPLPDAPGNWTINVNGIEAAPVYMDADRICLITVGDGSTARAGYVWQSTTKRDDGLHEHIYKRNDGK